MTEQRPGGSAGSDHGSTEQGQGHEPGSAGYPVEEPAPRGVGTLRTVALDVPDLQAAVTFWKALTGGTSLPDEDDWDWSALVTPDGWRIAFQLAPDLVAPQWPGQSYPQQAHLDLYVPDVAEASARATSLGAGVLQENKQWTTLADVAGHPFDLCLKKDAEGVSVMGVTFDCADASALARFWSALLDVPVTYDADGVAMLGGPRPVLFQTVADYNPPRWPDPAHPQQLHLDVQVPDLEAGETAALAVGATRLPGEGDGFRVFADPAGHPFCLVL